MTTVGFAVAGGRSLRMGRDKAFLPWGDTDLVGHTLRRLRTACAETAVLGSSRFADRGVPVHPDIVSNAGPLGGILTGLTLLEQGPGLFLAVDLPLVPVSLLGHLLALLEGHDAVVPLSPAGPEPLCAVYSRACAGPIRAHLERGENKMTSFWPDVRVRQVSAAELLAFGDPAALFLNVNSPADYERALALRER